MKRLVQRCLKTVKATDTGFLAVVCFSDEVCEGHFPGNPLVPAVVLIEAVRCAAERAAGKELAIARIVDAKFLAQVLPGQEFAIEAVFDGRRCDARLPGGTRIRLTLT